MNKSTKKTLLFSVLALILCVAMLASTTLAWFTDTASTAVNKIQAGNLDIQLLMHDGTGYVDISDDARAIFGPGSIAQNNNAETLWEPGKTQVAYLAIKNNGTLDLKYKVALDVENPTEGKNLYEVMQYAIAPDATPSSPVTGWTSGTSVTVGQQVAKFNDGSDVTDVTLPVGATHNFALVVHMKEEAGNTYQNGVVDFDLTVYAAQVNSESDSFGSSYDMSAEYDASPAAPPVISVGGESDLRAALATLSTTGTINLTQDIDMTGVAWDSPTMAHSASGNTITINGNGYTIKNLTSTGNQYGGLIGRLNTNGTVVIKDIKLENVSLAGTDVDGECAGGALIGWMDCHDGTVTVENVTVNGVSVSGFKYVGGLIGYKNGDTALDLKNCSVTGTDAAKTLNSSYNESNNYKGHIGGLVGYYGMGTMTGCSLTNVDITRGGAAQSDRAGVLVGTLASGASITSATVNNVTLLGAAVTSGSNMVGLGASAGTVNGVTVN